MASRKASRSEANAAKGHAIPDKQAFRIGEVARIAGVAPSVLRYWETEFPSLRAEKSRTNQRIYGKTTVARVLEVKTLLYDRGFTISGAKKALRDRGRPVDGALVRRIRREVEELLQLVEELG